MTQILKIDSSIFGEGGVSTQLTNEVVRHIHTTVDNAQIMTRDLSNREIPHFTAETINAISNNEAELADTLIHEVQNADIVVMGVPMYNFGVPSQLKAWFDHIARAGVTFKYTENGPVGLLDNKKVYVVTTRGGIHKNQATDIEVPFLKTILGFVGLTDVEFIFAEGLNMGDNIREKAIDDAKHHIETLFAQEELSA